MVAKPWEERFDFYSEQTPEGPVLVLADLAAEAHAPLASHPVRIRIVVPMQQPQANGLRSSEEAPALFALEERLVAALGALGGLYVGRLVTQGKTVLCFYVPASVTAEEAQRAAASVRGPYELQVKLSEDPAWVAYLEELLPRPLQRQLMANRGVLDSLARSGDRHELPREVDHFAYFPSAESAGHAAAALEAKGFAVQSPKPAADGGAQWALGFTRTDTLADGRADEVTAEVLAVVDAHGGHYDGWGCVVQKAKPGLLKRLMGRSE